MNKIAKYKNKIFLFKVLRVTCVILGFVGFFLIIGTAGNLETNPDMLLREAIPGWIAGFVLFILSLYFGNLSKVRIKWYTNRYFKEKRLIREEKFINSQLEEIK